MVTNYILGNIFPIQVCFLTVFFFFNRVFCHMEVLNVYIIGPPLGLLLFPPAQEGLPQHRIMQIFSYIFLQLVCMFRVLIQLELRSIYGARKGQFYFFLAASRLICYHVLVTFHILGQFLESSIPLICETVAPVPATAASACILGFWIKMSN